MSEYPFYQEDWEQAREEDQEMSLRDNEPTLQEQFELCRMATATLSLLIEKIQREIELNRQAEATILEGAGLDDASIALRRAGALEGTGIAEQFAKLHTRLEEVATEYGDRHDELEILAVQLYEQTQETHLGGVDITERKRLEILDVEKALDYAEKYLPKLVKTVRTWKNKRTFESQLRNRLEAGADDDIVEIVRLHPSPSAKVGDIREYGAEPVLIFPPEPLPTAPPGFVDDVDIPF